MAPSFRGHLELVAPPALRGSIRERTEGRFFARANTGGRGIGRGETVLADAEKELGGRTTNLAQHTT